MLAIILRLAFFNRNLLEAFEEVFAFADEVGHLLVDARTRGGDVVVFETPRILVGIDDSEDERILRLFLLLRAGNLIGDDLHECVVAVPQVSAVVVVRLEQKIGRESKFLRRVEARRSDQVVAERRESVVAVGHQALGALQ